MEVSEVKRRRDLMVRQIVELVRAFERDTDCTVARIDLYRELMQLGVSRREISSSEIEVNL